LVEFSIYITVITSPSRPDTGQSRRVTDNVIKPQNHPVTASGSSTSDHWHCHYWHGCGPLDAVSILILINFNQSEFYFSNDFNQSEFYFSNDLFFFWLSRVQ
jgi:hypothetical protein